MRDEETTKLSWNLSQEATLDAGEYCVFDTLVHLVFWTFNLDMA
jgi:hypothetical protein